jgi:hypothetical protein
MQALVDISGQSEGLNPESMLLFKRKQDQMD